MNKINLNHLATELDIHENVSLLPFNTFHIDVKAKYFVIITKSIQIENLVLHPVFKDNKYLILGSGSNILLKKDFDGLVIKIDIKGINVIKQTNKHVWVESGAGEIWNNLVSYCVNNNYGGIENLVLIPGTVGAAPLQNIGAYGAEICETFDHLKAVDLKNGNIRIFYNKDCNFSYRNSIFKNELKDKYVITFVCLKLNKKPALNITYGSVNETLKKLKLNPDNIRSVAEAISTIRQSKLPDPEKIGNAGSFFKNPVISALKFDKLKSKYADIPFYLLENKQVKIPAAWLIEKAGWKGKRYGNVGTAPAQALVIVNYGNASGNEIFELAKKIQTSVLEKFNINLETEVNVI